MRILVADDDATSRAVLRGYLRNLGNEVVEVENGKGVMDCLFRGDLPQLVFLDWMMPDVSGPEICQAIRRKHELPFTYVVLATSKSGAEDIIEGLRSGANDYLIKPLVQAEVEARVNVGLQMIDLSRTVAEQRLHLVSASKLAFLGSMASGMAHEINNPLAIIKVYASREADRLKQAPTVPLPADKASEALGAILGGVDRIAKVIQALRSFAAESDDEATVSVSVEKLLESVRQFSEARFKDAGVSLSFPAAQSDAAVRIQAQRVIHALTNLLDNSFKALCPSKSADHGWVRIEMTSDPQWVFLSVTDSGPGIPPEIREDIMRPFFSTRPVGQGSGLGLSVAKGIIEAQGGFLRLDATSQNTRFVLSLPRRSA